MEPYEKYPSLLEISIPERVDAARRSSLGLLQSRPEGVSLTTADILQAIEDLVSKQQYEVAEGAKLALAEFQANPQLALF